MKFVCLGYYQEGFWEGTPEAEAHALMDECFEYDDELRAKGHFADGHALDLSSSAKTIWWKEGKAVVTDGPYAETKEQIGGILILEARDLAHAVEIMSKHPGIKNGPFEIRPAVSLDAMIAESEKRRGVNR
jgi:hypothetical protein